MIQSYKPDIIKFSMIQVYAFTQVRTVKSNKQINIIQKKKKAIWQG